MPRVGITGHRRIPGPAAEFVETTIRSRLGELGTDSPIEGITSLAAGADQIFARLVMDAGGELRVVIPSHNYVSSLPDDWSRSEYQRLRAAAAALEQLPFAEPSEAAFLAAGRRVVELCDELIAVWDGLPARGTGGAAEIVEYAQSIQRKVTLAWPAGLQR